MNSCKYIKTNTGKNDFTQIKVYATIKYKSFL